MSRYVFLSIINKRVTLNKQKKPVSHRDNELFANIVHYLIFFFKGIALSYMRFFPGNQLCCCSDAHEQFSEYTPWICYIFDTEME